MLNSHEDDRRIIYDWANGAFKSAKALVAKTDCEVGGHYHKLKDEEFFLVQGMFKELQVEGGVDTTDQKAPCYVFVPRGCYHRFVLEKGSILMGTATEVFNPTDEHK